MFNLEGEKCIQVKGELKSGGEEREESICYDLFFFATRLAWEVEFTLVQRRLDSRYHSVMIIFVI